LFCFLCPSAELRAHDSILESRKGVIIYNI